MIRLKNISRTFFQGSLEVNVLKNIDLTIRTKEYVTITGSSGSGKSTLLSIIGCLDQPDTGSYLFNGKNICQLSEDQVAEIRNRKIGFVFQSFNLMPRLTALENVMLPLSYTKMPKAERLRRSKLALEKVNLADRMDFKPAVLSGGQKQRVAIARALVTEAALILADEPTGSLDSQNSQEIMAIFKELNHMGKTIVLITHEAEVAACGSRQIVLKDGQIIEES